MSSPDEGGIERALLDEEEDKPISIRLKLAQGLRRLPADWLNAPVWPLA